MHSVESPVPQDIYLPVALPLDIKLRISNNPPTPDAPQTADKGIRKKDGLQMCLIFQKNIIPFCAAIYIIPR